MSNEMKRSLEMTLGIAGGVILAPACIAAVFALCY